jgi:CRISPR-associated protein Cmr3
MIAGATRGRIGTDADGAFRHPTPELLLQEPIVGPFLVELNRQGEVQDWWFPAPADSLILNDGNDTVHRLVPLHLHAGKSNLPDGLTPVGLPNPIPAKPRHHAWWRWQDLYQQWLIAPAIHAIHAESVFDGLTIDERTHVAIDPSTGTVGAEGGNLFVTAELSFRSGMERQFAVAVATENLMDDAPTGFTMGGERRIVEWSRATQSLPELPDEVAKKIVADKRCRIVLLTPALYADGWRPRRVITGGAGVTTKIVGVAAGKPIVQSGWELQTASRKGGPNPSQRYAPAGTVYFVELDGSDEALTRWIQSIWMQSISDDEQAQRDGTGIAVLGVY